MPQVSAIAAPGLNAPFASGGYEFTVVASITETVTGVAVAGDGNTTVTFSTTGGTASIFYDSAASGGAKSVTSTGVGFDDGTLVGMFNVVAGAGFSNFTTFPSGTGGGFTDYDFVVSPTGVDASYIEGAAGTDRRLALHVEPGPASGQFVDERLPLRRAERRLRTSTPRPASAATCC